MQQKKNATVQRRPAASGGARSGRPARPQGRAYATGPDRASLASRLNSLRLTYLRRVPLFYRRVIAGAALGLVLAIILGVALSHAGNHADDATLTMAREGTAAPATGSPVSESELSQAIWGDGDSAAADAGGEDAVPEAETATAASSEAETGEAAATEADQFAPDAGMSARAAAAAASSSGETWRSGAYVPATQGEGYLPVFMKANRTDKVIAITVDDCYQTNNLRDIIDAAVAADAKLTIFPIGKMLARESLQEQLRRAHDLGFEIENHTWNHAGLYHNTDAELAKEIFNQDRGIDYILGINYHTHFLRPRGGDDRDDIRTHAYINQLGYYGIAHWSVCGTLASLDTIKKRLEPGAVYLFHTIDSDRKNLLEFIPYAVSQGYRLVTLNELFGYEKNAEEPLTDDPKTREVVQLQPYTRDYRPVKNPTYSYIAYEIQAKLIALGFLDGKPDGIYGKGTAVSAAKWQQSQGYKADGVLTTEQLHLLLDN